jgi:hypothetical protein
MTDPNYKALCAELADALAEQDRCWMLINDARAALAQPEPEGVTDEDWRHELNGRLWGSYKTIGYQGEEFMYDSDFDIAFNAICDAVLQRYSRPAIQPVPVSERLPGPEDCDGDGRCWWWHPDHKEDDFDDGWILLNPKWADGRRDSDDSLIYTHWLPANALPTPEAKR